MRAASTRCRKRAAARAHARAPAPSITPIPKPGARALLPQSRATSARSKIAARRAFVRSGETHPRRPSRQTIVAAIIFFVALAAGLFVGWDVNYRVSRMRERANERADGVASTPVKSSKEAQPSSKVQPWIEEMRRRDPEARRHAACWPLDSGFNAIALPRNDEVGAIWTAGVSPACAILTRLERAPYTRACVAGEAAL